MKITLLCSLLALILLFAISCGVDNRGTPSATGGPAGGSAPTSTPVSATPAGTTLPFGTPPGTSTATPAPGSTSVPVPVSGVTPSPTPFPPPSPSPEPVEGDLAIGGSLHAGDPDTGLTVTFSAVTGDSRCPKDVVCVWAGQADVLMLISGGGMPDAEIAVTLDPGTPKTVHVADSQYAIELLRLLPDPPPVGGVDQPDYRLSLRITQQPQGESAK